MTKQTFFEGEKVVLVKELNTLARTYPVGTEFKIVEYKGQAPLGLTEMYEVHTGYKSLWVMGDKLERSPYKAGDICMIEGTAIEIQRVDGCTNGQVALIEPLDEEEGGETWVTDTELSLPLQSEAELQEKGEDETAETASTTLTVQDGAMVTLETFKDGSSNLTLDGFESTADGELSVPELKALQIAINTHLEWLGE